MLIVKRFICDIVLEPANNPVAHVGEGIKQQNTPQSN